MLKSFMITRFGWTAGVDSLDILLQTSVKFITMLKSVMILISLLCFIILSQKISMSKFSDDSFLSGEPKNFSYKKDFFCSSEQRSMILKNQCEVDDGREDDCGGNVTFCEKLEG